MEIKLTVTGVSGLRQAKVWSKGKGENWTQELDYGSVLKTVHAT